MQFAQPHLGIPNGRLCTGLLVLVRSQLDSSQNSREQRQQPQRHCRWAPQLPPSLLGLPSFPLAVSFPRIFGILFVLSTHCRIARACACSSFHISVLRRINTALHSSAGVVLLLGKTTRLVSPREGTSRVVFPNKRTTSAKIWSVVRIPPVAKILDKASRDRVLVHPQPRPRASNTTTKQVRDPMSLKSMGGGPAESRGSDGKQYTIHTLS